MYGGVERERERKTKKHHNFFPSEKNGVCLYQVQYIKCQILVSMFSIAREV